MNFHLSLEHLWFYERPSKKSVSFRRKLLYSTHKLTDTQTHTHTVTYIFKWSGLILPVLIFYTHDIFLWIQGQTGHQSKFQVGNGYIIKSHFKFKSCVMFMVIANSIFNLKFLVTYSVALGSGLESFQTYACETW